MIMETSHRTAKYESDESISKAFLIFLPKFKEHTPKRIN